MIDENNEAYTISYCAHTWKFLRIIVRVAVMF